MYALHTTEGYVLASYPEREAGRVYKLLTRDLGFVYARAQGVRELKSRNRFALQTHTRTNVTLVRGRELWRVTGAYDRTSIMSASVRRVLQLLGGVLGRDEPLRLVYEHVRNMERWSTTSDCVLSELQQEAVTLIRIFHVLGYVPIQGEPVVQRVLFRNAVESAALSADEERQLVAAVNSALSHVPDA